MKTIDRFAPPVFLRLTLPICSEERGPPPALVPAADLLDFFYPNFL